MRNTTLILLAVFIAAFCAAQSSNVTATKIRAEESFRVGSTSSQNVTGFNLTMPAVPTHTKLPTTKCVYDWVTGSTLLQGGAAGGDLGGTYPNPSVDALQGFPVSATTPTLGQVLEWSGSQWVPAADDAGPNYSAGAGIAISGGNVISNTGDLSNSNEIQVLSLVGQDLTLSLGGGTVALPGGGGGSLGSGFTAGGGSGTIPDGTSANLDGNFTFISPDDTQIGYIDASGIIGFDVTGIGYFSASEILLAGMLPGFGWTQVAVDLTSGEQAQVSVSPTQINYGVSGEVQFTGSGEISFDAGEDIVMQTSTPTSRKLRLPQRSRYLPITSSAKAALTSLQVGDTIYCSNCTADDATTGVVQVYNGTVWKNLW